MSFTPYLNFNGNCLEAFTRYQEILGGELELTRMSDIPDADAAGIPPEHAHLVLNASLTVGGQVLMASDDPTGGFEGMKGMYVSYGVTDVDEAERVFAALADGGQVVMPIGETFWSPRFGMCVDRFGTPWMVNTEPAAS